MAQQKIDGQKAGSGSTRQPEIAPDSASSVTKLKMAVGLSEGEIEGFTRADVKLDGTPLTELSSDIVCDYRFGTNDQEYIPGIDEVANEIGVGVELRGDSDWVKLITNQDIDHVGIRLRWGPLQTSHSNGDITGVSITYEVHIAPVGGSYERVLSATLSDKTSDSYERYHEFKLPESDSGWMVRVARLTPSAQSSLVSDKMYVQAYSEIIKSKFTFPYTSLVYLEYDAKTFSNVAKVAVNAKGLIIKVPSNYDPVTRQYSGLWSGTFKMAYTNNPAWVYYDLVTNPRYGCGDRIDSSMVDKWSLYKLGQYCDQMVDDGYGGLEPRFTCNVYLQSKERAYDILNRLTGLFRAINFWNGSQLVVDADIPQDTSYLYTNANVVDGLFEYAGTAATDLYSAAKVAWDNPANGYNTEYEAVSYEHLVKKLGFKTLELDAWGCTSRGQALRAGRWALLAESDTVTFKVGMDGYLAMPGKIIEIQDEFYAGKSNGGRVISIDQSRTVITLDRPVTTISGDTISFNTALDGIKKYNIVSSSGSVVTVSESIDPSIENMHIWAINSSQLATQKYRILTVKYDGVGEFTISAVEYNPNKYEEIDSNIKFDEPPTSIINPVVQAAVQNVTITPSDFIYQGLNTVNLEIKWDRAENAVEYLVELKKDDGSWLKLPVTGNNSITLENVYAGAYIARVIAVSAFELKSLPTYSIKTQVSGKLTAPQPPTNLRSVSIMFGVEFYWDFPPNSSDTAVSRVAVSYVDPAFNVDESELVIYDKAYSDNKIVIQNLDIGSHVWVKVKLIDKLGFESPYTTWVSGQPSQDVDKVLDLISGHISESTLDQVLQGKIDSASNLANDAQNLATQANTAALQAVTTATDAKNTAVDAANDAATAVTTANTAASTANTVANDLVTNVQTLTNVINNETTSRTAADADLSSRITVTENNISSVSQSVTVLSNDLTTVSQGLATKADSTTVQALTNTVTQQGDQLSTNTNAITGLTSNLSTVEQQVAQKLDASAINNYYTKAETNQVAAGEVSQFKASLTNGAIGGMNLLRASSNERSVDTSTANEAYLPDYLIDTGSLQANTTYTLSGWIKGTSNVVNAELYFLHVSDATQHRSQTIDVTSNYSFFKFTFTTGALENQAGIIRIDNNGSTGGAATVWAKLVKLEVGEYATAWSPSAADVASADALTATNVNVSNLQGSVTAVSQTVTNLSATVESNNANLINNYYTKSSTDSVISAQIATFDASSSILDISSTPNPEKPNMWLLTVIEPNPSKPYNGSIIPDYALIKDAAIVERRYVDESATFLPASYANKILVFRTVVYASSERTINFGSFTGDDAHAIYVNRVKVFSEQWYANHANVSFELPKGVSVIDIMAANQVSAGGFSVQNYLASQVDWMQGAESADIRSSANTTAIQNIDSRVTTNKNAIDAVSASTVALTAKVGNTQSYTIVTFRNGSPASTITLPYGILDSRGVRIGNFNRGMNLVVFDINGNVESTLNYDTYGLGDSALYDLNLAIQGLAAGKVFALVGLDNIGFFEVSQSVINLRNTLLTCGASASYLNQWIANNLPIFIGRKDISTGNGIENIFISDIQGGWINYGLTLINGSPVGMGALNSLTRIVDANTSATSSLTSRVTQAENNITAVSNQNTALSADLQLVTDKTNAQANAISNLNATVSNIDGRVTSQASQVTTLTSAVWATRNRNYCLKPMVFNPSIVGLSNGLSAHNWYNTVVIDAAAGNGNWVSGLIGTTDYFAVNDGFGGAHTLSVDIYFEDVGNGHALLPPNVYFDNGQGYRSLLPVDPTAPAQLNTWRRFYCVFESNGSNLVNGHFGFGGTYGRFLLRNMKIEKNPFPTPFDEGDLAKAVTITDTALTVNGIKAIKTVTVDNNGVLSGYGLVSELVNGQVQSSFGVNADTFYIGAPSGGKKPFIQRTEWSQINGVPVPPGTYIDTAYIGSATIGTSHINDLAVTNAKIADLAVTNAKIANLAVDNAKIANLSVDTLKIANNAVTVPVYSYVTAVANMPYRTWTTCQSIWSPCSSGPTLFFFNFVYDCRRQDTKYSILCRILKNGTVVKDPFIILFFEANAGSANISSRPIGTIALNHTDTTLVDGNFELQLYVDFGNSLDVSNRYSTSLTVRK